MTHVQCVVCPCTSRLETAAVHESAARTLDLFAFASVQVSVFCVWQYGCLCFSPTSLRQNPARVTEKDAPAFLTPRAPPSSDLLPLDSRVLSKVRALPHLTMPSGRKRSGQDLQAMLREQEKEQAQAERKHRRADIRARLEAAERELDQQQQDLATELLKAKMAREKSAQRQAMKERLLRVARRQLSREKKSRDQKRVKLVPALGVEMNLEKKRVKLVPAKDVAPAAAPAQSAAASSGAGALASGPSQVAWGKLTNR